MLLRLGLFGALFFSIFWGIVDTFIDPTPENAAQILDPGEERVSKSKSLVDPFLAWAKGLNVASVTQLFKDADADVRTKLENNPLPLKEVAAATAGATGPLSTPTSTAKTGSGRVAAPAESGDASPKDEAEAGGDPGIDWYRE